jgi:hypothetical protein
MGVMVGIKNFTAETQRRREKHGFPVVFSASLRLCGERFFS